MNCANAAACRRVQTRAGWRSAFTLACSESGHSDRRGPGRKSILRPLSCLDKHVFVLSIADDEYAFAAAISDDELEVEKRRIDADERDRAVVVHARRNGAPPFSDIEDRGAALVQDDDVAERGVSIPAAERRSFGWVAPSGE